MTPDQRAKELRASLSLLIDPNRPFKRDAHWRLILQAAHERLAQLKGGALVIWWCAEHRTDAVAPSFDAVGQPLIGATPPYCWYWWYLSTNKEKLCHFVQMQLVPLPDRSEP